MLSTAKEVGDTTEGADKVDMTKARIVKGAFRVLDTQTGQSRYSITGHQSHLQTGWNHVSTRCDGWWFWFTVCCF